jgi:hypothetical protein
MLAMWPKCHDRDAMDANLTTAPKTASTCPSVPQSYLAGPLLVGARDTTPTDCGTLGGVYSAAGSPHRTFPGRVAAAGTH